MAKTVDIDVGAFPHYQICDDATFGSELANTRAGFLKPDSLKEQIGRPPDVHTARGAYMAGMRCPAVDRIIELVHNTSDIEDWEQRAIAELFEQLTPQECFEFMVSTDSSPRELASLLRTCNVRRAIVVNWINQFSSDPNWREDKALSIVTGEREYRKSKRLHEN